MQDILLIGAIVILLGVISWGIVYLDEKGLL